jgi:hypothetical protein
MPETHIHPDIERYQSDPLYAYLKKKLVLLSGRPPYIPARKLLIMESCGLLSFRFGAINADLRLREKDGMTQALEKVYVPLAACSFGDVPTADEFLAMPSSDISVWTSEAREINPSFFEWLNAAEKIVEKLNEEDLKKKEKKPRKSAPG